MKSLRSLILLSSIVSLGAMAEADSIEAQCHSRLRLDVAQKTALAKLTSEAQLKLKDVRTDLAKAKAALTKVMLAANATKEEAEAATAVLKEKLSAAGAIKSELKLDIAFDVLTAEQRLQRAQCESRARRPQQIGRRPIPHGGVRQIPHHRPGHIGRVPRGPVHGPVIIHGRVNRPGQHGPQRHHGRRHGRRDGIIRG